jgi:fucose permease
MQDCLTATIYVVLPVLAQSFGLTYTQVGLFKGTRSVAQAVLEMCSGAVAKRIGKVRVIVFGNVHLLVEFGASVALLRIPTGSDRLLAPKCVTKKPLPG